MASGLFVTGTDTGVGKTVVSAALVCLYRRRSPVCYWKPIQTGIDQDDDTAEVARLAECTTGEILADGIRLRHPVSPHRAAELAGVSISLAEVVAPFETVATAGTGRFWIVEGAGGVLVPINDDQLMIDVVARLGLPAVVVARTRVGTINHTLLTIEALRHRGLDIAAVVMAGEPDTAAHDAIRHYGAIRVVDLPVLNPLGPASVENWARQVSASWPI